MVVLKVRKVGNSLGVVFPKEVVSRLRTGEGQDVFLLEVPNNTYRITLPEHPPCPRQMSEPIWIEDNLVLAIYTMGCSSSTVARRESATNRTPVRAE